MKVRYLENVVKCQKLKDGDANLYKKYYPNDKLFDNAYVINGYWFPYGYREKPDKIYKPTNYQKLIMSNIINNVNDKYSSDLIIPICYHWFYHTWMVKDPLHMIWTPSYWFQMPVYSENKAIEIAKYLTYKFDETGIKITLMAIAGGWCLPKKEDPYNSFGDAYVKSGRFIDNYELIKKYWDSDNRIFFIK